MVTLDWVTPYVPGTRLYTKSAEQTTEKANIRTIRYGIYHKYL